MTVATISSALAQFAPSIARRRSRRSASAPAWSAKSSQGSVTANESPAISTGDLVNLIATSGNAILTMPSARLDRPAEVHSRQYAAPRADLLGRLPFSSFDTVEVCVVTG